MTTTTASATDVVEASVAAYTAHADAYEAFNADKMADTLTRFTAPLPLGARILDAGCGPGRDLGRLIRAGYDAVGVDANPTFVARASEHGPATLADLRALPYPDATFDAVWACASLVHLPPHDTMTALRELARVTVPGGSVYVSVKHAGPSGWTDTPHGRRWFELWEPDTFTGAVTATGLHVDDVDLNPVFLDVWAHRPSS